MPIPLTWPSFRDAFISPGTPSAHGVPPHAGGQLFVDAGGQRIGLILNLQSIQDEIPRPGRSLSVRKFVQEGRAYAELSTSSEGLFESFFGLASQIIRAVEEGEVPALALEREIQAWRDLLKDVGRMSAQQEIGLWGELRVLELLIDHYGDEAVEAWGGPLGDIHDFRMRGLELEVKTTVGALRRHTISSLQQLIASDGHRLHVVSQLLVEEPAPAGQTLPMIACSVEEKLHPEERANYRERLASAGYADSDAELYSRGYVLRAEPRLIDVGVELPIISRQILDDSLGVEVSRRVIGVSYQLDMDGLGRPLDAVLPI